jgi:hypothetical protein
MITPGPNIDWHFQIQNPNNIFTINFVSSKQHDQPGIPAPIDTLSGKKLEAFLPLFLKNYFVRHWLTISLIFCNFAH